MNTARQRMLPYLGFVRCTECHMDMAVKDLPKPPGLLERLTATQPSRTA